MSPAETAVRALCAAIYPASEVWHHVSAGRGGRRPTAHYILRGPARCAHVTEGHGATEDAAWADAEQRLRRDAEGRRDRARVERDLHDAEIARLTAALEVAT